MRHQRSWPLLFLAVLMEVSATLSLRAAIDRPIWAIAVVVGYVAAYCLLAKLLTSGERVGVIFGLWSAAGVTATVVMAAVVFGDPLTWRMAAGIVIVLVGVLLIELGNRDDEPTRPTANPMRG